MASGIINIESKSFLLKDCIWLWTLLFLTLGFFSPIGFDSVSGGIYTAILLVLACADFKHIKDRVFDKYVIIVLLALAISIIIILGISPYGKSNTLSYSLFIIDCFILFIVLEIKENETITRVFYLISSSFLTATFLIYLIDPYLFINFGGLLSSRPSAPVIYGAPDKNWTAVFIFLYCCIAIKKRWRYGIVLGLLYPLLYFGRQYVLMLVIVILLFSIHWYKKKRYCCKEAYSNRIRINPAWFFSMFVLSTILTISVSYYWTENVIGAETVGYKTSLNDSSNAMRAISNIYAIEIIKQDPSFLLYGYDTDIFTQLGISPNDTSVEANVYINGMWRLVQPHEEVLNALLKEGLLFTILYYILVSYLLSKMVKTKEDFFFVLAYFVGSMLLSSMFKDEYLLMLMVVLCVNNRKELKSTKERNPLTFFKKARNPLLEK